MWIVVDRLSAELCPVCVTALRAGTIRGPIGAAHDVSPWGAVRVLAVLTPEPPYPSAAPCVGCGSSASVIRSAVRLRVCVESAPPGYETDAEQVDPSVLLADAVL